MRDTIAVTGIIVVLTVRGLLSRRRSLVMLLLASVTGLLLLALRESAAMGTLLVVHLGVIAALYLTLPYGKFAHVVYRYAALVKYQIEMSQATLRNAGH